MQQDTLAFSIVSHGGLQAERYVVSPVVVVVEVHVVVGSWFIIAAAKSATIAV